MPTLVELDDLEFEAQYRPVREAGGAWRDFSWADPMDAQAIGAARDSNRLWTTISTDGFVSVLSGWHFVNRLGYVITEVPYAVDDAIEVVDKDERDEWEQRCALAEELGLDVPDDLGTLLELKASRQMH